jgi:hypothetical protein
MDATPRMDDGVDDDLEVHYLTTPAPTAQSYNGYLRAAPAVQRSGWSNRFLEAPSTRRVRAAPILPHYDELRAWSGEGGGTAAAAAAAAAPTHSYHQPRIIMARLPSRSTDTSFDLPIGSQSWMMTHTTINAAADGVDGYTWMTPSRGYTIATTTTTAGTTIFTRFEDELNQGDEDDDDKNSSPFVRLNVVSPYMPTLPMHDESDHDDDDDDDSDDGEFKPPKLKMLCTNKHLRRIHPFATHTK